MEDPQHLPGLSATFQPPARGRRRTPWPRRPTSEEHAEDDCRSSPPSAPSCGDGRRLRLASGPLTASGSNVIRRGSCPA
eukprot:16428589-Heterocapsa_arctica.AAC.1